MTPSERVQRILSKRRRLNEQDRLFLLSYAGNTPKTSGQTISTESVDQLFRNLIIILNHFFEYGFIKQSSQSNDNTFDSLASNGEMKPIEHYWDLISKYFSYYSSVSYINSQLEDE